MGMNDTAKVVEQAQSLFYNRALITIRGEVAGAMAAIPLGAGPDLNYSEIFIRDNVPVMVYLLLEGKGHVVRHFLNLCLELQSQSFQTKGIFPTSFVEVDGSFKVDYGQRAIGRVCSVDATLWWVILAYWYVQWTEDNDWAAQPKVQEGLEGFLNLVLHPGFRDAPTLLVPDGAFMIDRPLDVWGVPLEVQTLLYGALKCTAALLDFSPRKTPQHQARILQTIDWAKRLRTYLLKNYWIDGNIVQTLRRRPNEQYGEAISNEHNVYCETIPNWLQGWLGKRGGYLIGNIRTGRPDFRFFSLGNCLGGLFDVISPAQKRSLFRLIINNQHELIADMPLRICHPPLEGTDWQQKTGFDRKNLPWSYHNGGHWPCLLWFLSTAVLQHKTQGSVHVETLEMEILIQRAYKLMAERLPHQKWAEYFDGPTGIWVGQQARTYQTWTIVGFLLVHHFLKVRPRDVRVLAVPSLQSLHQQALLLT